jgi:hypothetical protein
MAATTSSLRTGMFDGYQLPEGRTVADIGGCDGSVLVELLTRDRDAQRRAILFDRPTTVPSAGPTLSAAGLTDRGEVPVPSRLLEPVCWCSRASCPTGTDRI